MRPLGEVLALRVIVPPGRIVVNVLLGIWAAIVHAHAFGLGSPPSLLRVQRHYAYFSR